MDASCVVAAGHAGVGQGVTYASRGMQASLWEGRHLYSRLWGVWGGAGRLLAQLRGAGRHPVGPGFRLKDVASGGPRDGIGERKSADAAVQGSHLTAGA